MCWLITCGEDFRLVLPPMKLGIDSLLFGMTTTLTRLLVYQKKNMEPTFTAFLPWTYLNLLLPPK